MNLEVALNRSQTCEAFYEIFNAHVHVKIDKVWGVDLVSVEGYTGSISTDFIAEEIIAKFSNIKPDESAIQLAELLKNKVFIPLRERVVKLEINDCSALLFYTLRNIVRISYTPDCPHLSHGYAVLKHSMCLSFLDPAYDIMGSKYL